MLPAVLGLASAVFRGFADAGGFKFGWFQGYHELNFSSNYRSTALFWEMHLGAPRWTGFGCGGRLNVELPVVLTYHDFFH